MRNTGTSAQATTIRDCEDCLDHAYEAAAEHLLDRMLVNGETAIDAAEAEALAADYIARGLTAPCSAHTV